MRFGLGVAFETILVTALFLADLAVLDKVSGGAACGEMDPAYPSQSLETFGFELVIQVFRASDLSSRHLAMQK